METPNKTTIKVEADIVAPIEKVWKYWTEPQHITQWNNASEDWHTPHAENDLREENDLAQLLAAGLSKNGEGLLLPLPPRLLARPEPRREIEKLRDNINKERLRAIEGSPTCELWLPDVCFLQPEPNRDLILQLYDIAA